MALGNLFETLKQVDVAFVTLFGGLILGRLAGKLCARLLKEAEVDRIGEGVSDALGAFVSYTFYFITILLVLQQFKLTQIALVVFGTALLVFMSVVALLVIADLAPNAALGFLLRGRLRRYVGRRLQIGKAQGELVSIGWIDCVLKDKEVYALPYRYVRKEKVRLIR